MFDVVGQDIETIYAERLLLGGGKEVQFHRIDIKNGLIAKVRPYDRDGPIDEAALYTKIAAPGFIDLQINGACDLQFNEAADINGVKAITFGARVGGSAYVLPTMTTAPGAHYTNGLAAVSEAIKQSYPVVLGIHLESPFLSPERTGIHSPENMRQVSDADVANIVGFKDGRVLLTLAPERQPNGAIAKLAAGGVIVFVGHSTATYEDMSTAFGEGLNGATHLYNAMSQMTVRAPGVVGAMLSTPDLFAGIIADGYHVAWANFRLAASQMPDGLFLVTDAMRTLEGKKN